MLFEAVTKMADREGVKCYLESSKNVPNVKIYERMGFEMRMEMECRDGENACMVWFFADLSLLSFPYCPSSKSHGLPWSRILANMGVLWFSFIAWCANLGPSSSAACS